VKNIDDAHNRDRKSRSQVQSQIQSQIQIANRKSQLANSAAAVLLLAAALFAYANSFSGVLVFDDEPALAGNPHIRQLWPLTTSLAAPRDTTLAGRPVASFTFALNYALAPDEVRDALIAPPDASDGAALARVRRNLWGYHAVNLAIHALAALTLFGAMRRTLLTAPLVERFGNRASLLALAIAVLWLLHPIQTNSVTYVVQRVEALMGLFYLLTLYCAIRAHAAARRAWWTAGAVVACVLGMATKEAMVTAPLLVVLWDCTFADRTAWRTRRPLYGALAATWIVVVVLAAGGPRMQSVGFTFPGWPWWRYALTQAGVVAHYVRLAIVPAPLVLDYDWPAAASVRDVAAPLALVAALVAWTIRALGRRLPAGFAGAWFLLILAPTSSVLPIVTEVAAEHRLYLPLAAVIALVILCAYAVASSGWRFRALALGSSAIAIWFAALTIERNRDFSSAERMWLDTLQKRPSNARAQTNYAADLLRRGRFADAEQHLRIAVGARPDLADAQTGLGVALCAQGKLEEGMDRLERAIAIQPDHVEAHRNLGEALASRGDLARAVEHYLRALAGAPDDVALVNRAAWILSTAPDSGIRNGLRAVSLAEHANTLTVGADPITLDTLAAAYAEAGRFDEAARTAEQALARAQSTGQMDLLAELRTRLSLYKSQRPFRTP
jgi:protein O-mannosyl-transferase